MKVLVIGSGGREHAMAWKLAQSKNVSEVIVVPGNGGTEWEARNDGQLSLARSRNVAGDVKDIAGLVDIAQKEGVGLTAVGPEIPLALGVVDAFQAAGLNIFGPTQAAAQLESSKAYSKDFMAEIGIPTAEYGTFTNQADALAYLDSIDHLVVVKASGLAAGKGVIVCDSDEDARDAVAEIIDDKRFGAAGDQVVIEERLTGPELSLIAICDGKTAKPLIHSRDHKRAYDGDRGPNTGGMGAYAPVPEIGPDVVAEVMERVIQPTVDGMANRGTPFVGVLYAGIMLTPHGIKTLEFNCRFGDPETQVVLPMLKSDLAEIMLAAINGQLEETEVENHEGTAATVVMASGGYPGHYVKGKRISGLDLVTTATVFHASTKVNENQFYTVGGRVLAVTGRGDDLQAALDAAYHGLDQIMFENAEYRTDIGASSLKEAELSLSF